MHAVLIIFVDLVILFNHLDKLAKLRRYGVAKAVVVVSRNASTLEVWAKEKEVAGLRASLNTLMSEIQCLNKLCTERKEAKDSLRKKGKKIEEFDGRRSELESIYNALLKDFF
ncbi:AUGMIN subunit 5 [Camellia lanceoleosa]|uniref:AUGMIN subunit 5 n=1 Tax=Camellia lanceoleosa TaxID=1840588 RepID=A0ACC0FX58_9ERIC|nr:AUGMIN subunit 5 [Camellia lanceoleosa]